MIALQALMPAHRRRPFVAGPPPSVRVGPGGIPLGRFADGTPALLDLVRHDSITVAAFVDLPSAAVLALRARATGARVIARGDDLGWQVVERATRGERSVQVIGAGEGLPGDAGTFARPVFVVDDTGGRDVPGVLPPWSIRVALLPAVSFATLSSARSAELVLFGRRTHREADLVATSWRLPAEAAEAFRGLRRWEVGVVTGGRHAVVDLALTEQELHLQASVRGWQGRGGPHPRAGVSRPGGTAVPPGPG